MAITKVTRTLLSTGIDDQSNATAITIDSSENVGIGTTSPASKLELETTEATVFDGTATDGQAGNGSTLAIQNLSDTNNTFSQILFRNRSTSKAVSRIASLTDSTGTEMAFVVENNGSPNEVLRIDKTGNVGIGTTSPGSKLSISDSGTGIGLTNAASGNFNIGLLAGTGSPNAYIYQRANAPLLFGTNNAEKMRIDASGNVGIGTTSPNAPLEVNGGTTMTGGWGRSLLLRHPFPMMVFQGEYSTDTYAGIGYDNTSGMQFMVNSPTIDLFANSQSAAMVIDNSGNCGIGTTSPAYNLQIDDASSATLQLKDLSNSGTASIFFADSTQAFAGFIQYNNSGNYFRFGTNDAERMRIDSSGNLLINQTSSNLTYGKLQVSAGGETAGWGGIVGFFDTDSSVASSNLIQLLKFSSDTDATGGQFIRFSDSNSTMGSVSAASGTTVSYNTSSDRRMKENIVDASSQLEVINNIQVREFDWKKNGHHEVGLIAQELNEVIPNVVQEGGEDVNEQPWGVDYGKLTPYLVKAIQELSDKVDNQQTIIDNLKTRIETLENA